MLRGCDRASFLRRPWYRPSGMASSGPQALGGCRASAKDGRPCVSIALAEHGTQRELCHTKRGSPGDATGQRRGEHATHTRVETLALADGPSRQGVVNRQVVVIQRSHDGRDSKRVWFVPPRRASIGDCPERRPAHFLRRKERGVRGNSKLTRLGRANRVRRVGFLGESRAHSSPFPLI